jgi:hypothetical protein
MIVSGPILLRKAINRPPDSGPLLAAADTVLIPWLRDMIPTVAQMAKMPTFRSLKNWQVQVASRNGTIAFEFDVDLVSSLESTARSLLSTARTYRGIENKLHQVLDLAFREDDSRVRKGDGPENMAALQPYRSQFSAAGGHGQDQHSSKTQESRSGISTGFFGSLPGQDGERLLDQGHIHVSWICGLPQV